MGEQHVLFPDAGSKLPGFGTGPEKLVRRQGASTSVHAACAVDSIGLEKEVYEVIERAGRAGCISDDVRDALPYLPYSSVTARYKALMDKRLVEDTGERRAGSSGRMQRVMRAKGQ